jgi:hypothetical protein
MAITRTLTGIDVQWDNGDPVLTLRASFYDDVEETDADRRLVTRRSAMNGPALVKFDAFLDDALAFAGSKVAGPIGFPV